MTMTSGTPQNKVVAGSAGGHRVVRVSSRTIAAARAHVAISKSLGRPLSDTVRKIAAVR